MKKKYLCLILFITSIATAGLPIKTILKPDPFFGPVNWFGWSLATGDFNGDGIEDIVVGSPRSDFVFAGDSIVASGRVDIFFGPIDAIEDFPDMILTGQNEGDQFGISLSSAGDFNGDGYEDILVGANVVEHIGGAYVFFGGPFIDEIPDVVFLGENIVDNFGYSCTGIGDQNSDGKDDVLIGALYNDAMGSRSGRCYIYFGGSVPDPIVDLVITGLDSLDDFGTVVSGPLDFNNDSNPDFLVGAVQAGGYWYKPGAGYIFYGGDLLDDIPEIIINGTHPMEFFGNGAAALGDFNGDSVDDAIFSGYNHHEPPDSAVGRIVGTYGSGAGGFILVGDRPNQTLGGEIASAGDIDFDGLCEFAASMTYDPSGDSAGFVRIYGYDVEGDSVAVDSTCWNPAPSDRSWFGYRMAGCDDLTGDGLRNFAVADPMFDLGEGMQGVVYIYSGWRDRWPIEAEFILPERGIISACPRQEIKIKLRHPSGLRDLNAVVRISDSAGERIFTIDSTQLDLVDDSTLVFSPSIDWDSAGWIVFSLDSAYFPSTGESIDSAIFVEWYSDLTPPRSSFLGDSGETADRYPSYIWEIEEEYINRVDTAEMVVICGSDSITPVVFPVEWADNFVQVAVLLSDFDIRPACGETITVCLDNIMDMPDTCGPNIAEPNCISRIFYRAWNTDLTFSSPGLSPTVLTLGAELSATDGFDPGLDIFMPPIPESRVDAAFSMDDPAHPYLSDLLRDLRASDDDTLEWRIITQGEGEAVVVWIPEELPVGVWLVDGKLDMRAYPQWHFALGDTLSIKFYTGPKVLMSFDLLFEQWELFSLPIYPESYDPDYIIGREDCSVHRYAYDAEEHRYFVPERWPTGMGVWFFSDIYWPHILAGWPIDTMWSQLSPGWNMIAAPFDTTPPSAIATEPPGAIVSGTLYGYDSVLGEYFSVTELAPMRGYWVASSREAELYAPGDGSPSAKYAFNIGFGNPPPPPSLTGQPESEKPLLPNKFSIFTYPNPFNSSVRITLDAPVGEGLRPSRVEIFDLTGRRMAQLPSPSVPLPEREGGNSFSLWEKVAEGRMRAEYIWQPDENITSGIYLVRARFDSGEKSVKRIIYLK